MRPFKELKEELDARLSDHAAIATAEPGTPYGPMNRGATETCIEYKARVLSQLTEQARSYYFMAGEHVLHGGVAAEAVFMSRASHMRQGTMEAALVDFLRAAGWPDVADAYITAVGER